MGAIHFDFDAILDQAVQQESTPPAEFSRLAVLAGAQGQNQGLQRPNVSKLAGLAGAPPRFPPSAGPQKRPCPPANDANLLTFSGDAAATATETPASASHPSAHREPPANSVSPADYEPDQLGEWRHEFSAVDPDRPPKGYPNDLWRHLHRDGSAFLDTWGAKAAALGWSTLDLFGVHRIAPVANYAAMGLVPLLRGAVIVALTVDEVVTRRGAGAALTFRRHPPHSEAIPVWELTR